MKNFYQYKQEFCQGLPRGTETEKGIKRAIDAALAENEILSALYLYYEYIEECVFHDDAYEAVILFPEFVALAEEHPEYHNRIARDLMWSYKWMISNYVEFYQISKNQLISLLQNYENCCNRFNYSKRTYYKGVFDTLLYIGKDESINGLTLRESRELKRKCDRDSLSDCRACELDDEIKYILYVEDDIEKALVAARPLFIGTFSCTEVPDITYARFSNYYLQKGDFEKAEEFADKSWRLINRHHSTTSCLAEYEAMCILTFAYTNPKKALAVFKKTFPFCFNMKNGIKSLMYYYAVYHLMRQLEMEDHNYIQYNFPDTTADIYNPKGRYYISDIKDYMYSHVTELMEKFDKRNENTYCSDLLTRKYESGYSNSILTVI